VTVIVADTSPNFSICGIPYYIFGRSATGATSHTAPPRTSSHRHAAANTAATGIDVASSD
jgi:hypothetical protein